MTGPFPIAMLVYQRVFGFGPRYLKSTGDFSGEVCVTTEILYGDRWKNRSFPWIDLMIR